MPLAAPSPFGFAARRGLRILLAYVVATITLVTVLPLVGLVGDTLLSLVFPGQAAVYFYLVAILFFGMAYWVAFAAGILPALAWILVSEWFALRRRVWHVLATSAGASAAWLIFFVWSDKTFDAFTARITADVAIAGLAAGLVYWSIAGRSAGAWRPPAP